MPDIAVCNFSSAQPPSQPAAALPATTHMRTVSLYSCIHTGRHTTECEHAIYVHSMYARLHPLCACSCLHIRTCTYVCVRIPCMRVYMTCRYTGRDWYEQSKCLSATSAPHSRHRNMLSLCICIKTRLHREKRRWTCNVCAHSIYACLHPSVCMFMPAYPCMHISNTTST